MKGQDHSMENQASAYLAARREAKQRRAGIMLHLLSYLRLFNALHKF